MGFLMFTTFNAFVKSQYEERCENPVVAAIYRKEGGFKAFKKSYTATHDFSKYLETLRGLTLSAAQTYHLAKMYLDHGDRKISELPAVLSSACRYYDIELPVVYGILTVNYWQERFGTTNQAALA